MLGPVNYSELEQELEPEAWLLGLGLVAWPCFCYVCFEGSADLQPPGEIQETDQGQKQMKETGLELLEVGNQEC